VTWRTRCSSRAGESTRPTGSAEEPRAAAFLARQIWSRAAKTWGVRDRDPSCTPLEAPRVWKTARQLPEQRGITTMVFRRTPSVLLLQPPYTRRRASPSAYCAPGNLPGPASLRSLSRRFAVYLRVVRAEQMKKRPAGLRTSRQKPAGSPSDGTQEVAGGGPSAHRSNMRKTSPESPKKEENPGAHRDNSGDRVPERRSTPPSLSRVP
jgi:hypothetical protein